MSDAIKALAANMVGRKKTDPYILFLGAGASISSGCSSMMKIVDNVLESHDSTQFNDWQNEFKKANSIDAEFGKLKKQEIDKQKRDRFFKIWSGLDRDSQYEILRPHLWEGKSPSDGYNDLAQLIKAGYIKMVLSTNLDNLLEVALTNAGWRQSDNFIVVVNGKDRSREVHEQLGSSRDIFKLIKLHGTLESPGSYAFTLGEVFDFEKIIKPSLSRIVNQSLIVVGHSMQDRDIDMLFDGEGGEIHFVNPIRPEDWMDVILKVRGQGSIIDGDNGKFDNFFRELCISINEISSKKQPNVTKVVDEGEYNSFKEVTTSNEFYKITTNAYFIEDPFEKGEFEKKSEKLFYFGEKTKSEGNMDDVIAKLYKYKILLITGKPRVGKTTFLLSFIDEIIKKRLGGCETLFFINPDLSAEEFEKEVLDQIESKLEFREYTPNKVLLVIDGLRRMESDRNYINKCKTLFKKVSDKGYRLIATLRDDQHETLKREFSDREKWGTDKWANFHTEEIKIEPNFNFNDVKMVLINYLNYYKDKINLNFSFTDPEFNSCVGIVVNKTEGIIGDVVYLIEDMSIGSREFSRKTVDTYPIGSVNQRWNTIKRDYYIGGGKVLPPLILLLTNQKYSVTKEFIDKFVKWRIRRLDESSFTEEKIKEILTKSDNLADFYTKKIYFGTGIRIPEYKLKEDWREAIEKGMAGECGEEFKDLVQIFESVDLNFLVVQFFLDLQEEFKNGFLSYQEVDWYVVGDTAKIWGMDIAGLDVDIKLGALKFATEFFINSPKLYKNTTPAKFLARTLSLLWKRAYSEVSDDDLGFVIEFYRGLSSDSEDYWSCWMLGEFYRKKNDDEALNWYIESANRRSTSKGYRSLIYILKEYRKDPKLSEDIVELQEKAVIKAIELGATNFRNWDQLGDILEYKGKLFKNKNKYRRAIKNFDDAIKAYEKVKEIGEKLLSPNDKFWCNIAIGKITDSLTERSHATELLGRLEDRINYSFAMGGRLSSKTEDLETYLDAIAVEPRKIQPKTIPLKGNNEWNKRKEIYPRMTLDEILEKTLEDLLSIESGIEDRNELYNKQNAFFKLKKYGKAIEYADKILKLEQNSFVFIHKGRALGKLKKYKEALECYDKAISVEQPINVFALTYKGFTLEKIGKLEDALECYNEAIDIKPNGAMAYSGKGSVLDKLEKYGEALRYINKALELSNYQYAYMWVKKGLILSKSGKDEDALECYNEAIKIDPTDVSTYTEKSWALSRLERYEMVLECIDKALELSNYQYASTWVEKGLVLSKLGKDEDALECYNEAIKIDPTDVSTYTEKSWALSRLERYEMVLECIDKALELSNYQYVPAWIRKGFALEKLEKLEKAIECYDKVLQIDPTNTVAWNNKGFALSKLEKSEEALDCYNETLKIDPGNVVAFKHRTFELKKVGRCETPTPFSKISNTILKDILQEINKNLEDYDFIKNVFDEKFSNENKSKTYLIGILDKLVSMSLKQASKESPFEKSAKIFQSCQIFCEDLYGKDYKQIFSDLFNSRVISRFGKVVLEMGYNMGPIISERECKDLLKDFERTFGELGVKAPTLDEIKGEVSKSQNNHELRKKINIVSECIFSQISKKPGDYELFEQLFKAEYGINFGVKEVSKKKKEIKSIIKYIIDMSLAEAFRNSAFDSSAKIFQSCQKFCEYIGGEKLKQEFKNDYYSRVLLFFRNIIFGNEYHNICPVESKEELITFLNEFEKVFGDLGLKTPTLDEIENKCELSGRYKEYRAILECIFG